MRKLFITLLAWSFCLPIILAQRNNTDNIYEFDFVCIDNNANWTLTDPNKVEINIKNGSTNFTNGTAFFFSILNANNPRNEIKLGGINVFDGNY